MEIDIFNKIKWDKTIIDRGAYDFYYWDNIQKKLIRINWYDIIEFDKDSALVHNIETGKDSDIPLHRFKKITHNNETIFDRT